MKDEVIAEELLDGSGKIIISPYDIETKTIIGGEIETTTRKEALKKYIIVAEMINGEVRINDDYYEQDDYAEFFTGDDYYEE